MTGKNVDRWVLTFAATAALCSVGWFTFLQRRTAATTPVRSADAVTPAVVDSAEAEASCAGCAVGWPAASPQPRGPNWIYEVFTPPNVILDPLAQRMEVKPGGIVPGENAADKLPAESGETTPFRLQLIGHFGAGRHCRGIFQDSVTGETKLARVGDTLTPDYVVDSLAVQTTPLSVEDPATVWRVAVAVLRHAGDQTTVALTDRKNAPALANDPVGQRRVGASSQRAAMDSLAAGHGAGAIDGSRAAPFSLSRPTVEHRVPPQPRILLAPGAEMAGMPDAAH